MHSRAARMASRNSASTSRACACPPKCGRVRAIATRASSNQGSTAAGQADGSTTGAGGTFSPVACRQRSRTRSSSARAAPPGLVRSVLGQVPAAGREIDAAAEREPAIDNHELLVLAATGRMVAVELEAQPFRGLELQSRQELAVQSEKHRPVPDQN